jgi:hypothetical protein
LREQPADAVPGRSPGDSGRAPESHRDDGLGRGLSRGFVMRRLSRAR